MNWHFHSASRSYALALWLATVLALFLAFFLQLEPAQWAGITVWIVFIQNPRMNYSKIIWWAFGTVTGAAMAVLLTVCFSQTPELFLLFLALWLAGCASAATLVSHYRAYGAVLAGYTCAIVSMSAVDHPDFIFQLAVTRVSCIFIGMTSAIVMINIFLPKHRHWRETRHHLAGHLQATLLQAAKALNPAPAEPAHFTWRHLVDRLSTLEHTLDLTTAESADSRSHAPPARSLVATLFDLLAKAQAVEMHLARPGAFRPSVEVKIMLQRTQKLLESFAATSSAEFAQPAMAALGEELGDLQKNLTAMRENISGQTMDELVSNRFLLDRLDEILAECAGAVQDWSGLFGPWTARRPSRLAVHQDYRTAFIYGWRMFLAITLAGALWFITQWPSGPQFILFIAVVCSLLSLVDHAPELGFPFLKSAAFCAIMAYVETFWLFQKAGGFLMLALMLGLFLLPAAYAYRHPRLIGGAVVSMLIFYGLTMTANQMNYDIATFLNNGMALLVATACGFFAFHAVPSLNAPARQFWLLRAVRGDLAQHGGVSGVLSEQGWTSLMFDRLRLLHRAARNPAERAGLPAAENEMLISLQLGLRRRSLHAHLENGNLPPPAARVVADALREFRKIAREPRAVAPGLRSACLRFEEMAGQIKNWPASAAGALAEMREMACLLEASPPPCPE